MSTHKTFKNYSLRDDEPILNTEILIEDKTEENETSDDVEKKWNDKIVIKGIIKIMICIKNK